MNGEIMKIRDHKERISTKGIIVTFLLILAFICISVSALEPNEIIMSQVAQNQPVEVQPAEVNADAGMLADNGIAADTSASTCPGCDKGLSTGTSGTASSTAGLSANAYTISLRGGYVASGTGLRNRGWGTIVIRDMPYASTKYKAFLFWSVIGPDGVTTPPTSYATGKFNGVSITGTYLGSAANPCWNTGRIFGYRADVTSLVSTNGVYHLTDFASGTKYGDDPWTISSSSVAPMTEGASLVIVYTKADYPLTWIQIKNGVETTKSSTTTTVFSGIPASTLPVAKTTFIVADGQSSAVGKSVKFNGVTLPSFVTGTDRQNGINFKYGNLQDTNTAYVKVGKSATSASASITTGNDCITWLGQVLAVYDGNVDTDGDALKDSWEINGYDHNGDGVTDVWLQLYGANAYHKDIFVWIDYMDKSATETKTHQPDPSVITRAAATFANANYASQTSTRNVDGTPGINIHSYVMWKVPHDDNLQPVWTEVDAIKNLHFSAPWREIFHYCLFAHKYEGGTSSGISRGIPASDFIVTLGGWSTNPGTPDQQTGTYIHELGHNLGLMHGGADHDNYKPNHLSIMSYYYQMSGVYRNGKWGNYDYQRITPYSLNENALLEANGIGTVSAGYGTYWVCPNNQLRFSTVNKPINWDCDAVIDTSPVSVNLNPQMGPAKTILNSRLEWQYILYRGGLIGGVGPDSGQKIQLVAADKMDKELTEEDYLKLSEKMENAKKVK
jgi:hypothetical protein